MNAKHTPVTQKRICLLSLMTVQSPSQSPAAICSDVFLMKVEVRNYITLLSIQRT